MTQALLRPWRPGDEASLARHANDRSVWRNLKDKFPYPYTTADAGQWIREVQAAIPETQFAVVVSGEAAGAIGLELKSDVFYRTAEIGFWLGRAHWGRGIMTEAVRAVTDFAFLRFDLLRIEAGVFEWNPASMRVLQKAGFDREGRLRKRITKDGQTLDEVLYAVVRG